MSILVLVKLLVGYDNALVSFSNSPNLNNLLNVSCSNLVKLCNSIVVGLCLTLVLKVYGIDKELLEGAAELLVVGLGRGVVRILCNLLVVVEAVLVVLNHLLYRILNSLCGSTLNGNVLLNKSINLFCKRIKNLGVVSGL